MTAEQVEDVRGGHAGIHPADATHWSRTSMAERTGLSQVHDRADLEGL